MLMNEGQVPGKWPRAPSANDVSKRLHVWRQNFPTTRLIDLLPVIELKSPDLVRPVIERIERNQKDSLTPEDRVFLEKLKSRLGAPQ